MLFDFIEEIHEKGEPLERALPDAGIERIRPVITVGATILACFLWHSKVAHSGNLSATLTHGVAPLRITVSDSPKLRGAAMIKFLAQLFRGLHYIVGVSAPSPGTSDRTFVFAWLGGIAFIVAFFVILVFYIIPFLYFKH